MNRRRATERAAIVDGIAARRYSQCDATCTVDCGHCKGAGLIEQARDRAVGPNGTRPLPMIPSAAPVKTPHLLRAQLAQAVRIARRFVGLLLIIAVLWLGVIVGAVELWRHPAVLDGIVVALCVAFMVGAIYVVHERTHWWRDEQWAEQFLTELREL